MVCQGGLNDEIMDLPARLDTLKQLEELDKLLARVDEGTGQKGGKITKELKKVKKLENKQARILHKSLSEEETTTSFGRKFAKFVSSQQASRVGTSASLGSKVVNVSEELGEFSLLDEVAAAKIQRRVKEAFQRR